MDFQISWHLYEKRFRHKYQVLYHALRDAILAGTLPYGTKLPSSRELAQLYQISRGTVNQVYEMLAAEGYLSAKVGRGTFAAYRYQPHASSKSCEPAIQLSDWGKRMVSLPLREPNVLERLARISFSLGLPDVHHFPVQEWKRLHFAQIRDMFRHQQKESFLSQGHLPLREAISQYLRRARGIDAEADDVVIVNGSMQAIALLTYILVNPGDRVIHEDPGFPGIRRSIVAAGGIPCGSPVDQEGIRIENWDSRLLFVTPSRQFPTGVVLSLKRRQEILQWASERHAIIVEDDYDSEFRRGGKPIEPLKALDHEGRVVYIGTFSKTLLPDLRVGYVVLPAGLREPFRKARQLFEPHPTSIVEQRTIAAFMNSGMYEKHLRRMKRIYRRKHDTLLRHLQEKVAHLFAFTKSDAGLHVFARWKHTRASYLQFKNACAREGIYWTDASSYFSNGETPAACFGFSHLTESEMEEGVEMMRQIWEDFVNKGGD
jgi:GntR family transcriptional regulator/MocR family aminotransferase